MSTEIDNDATLPNISLDNNINILTDLLDPTASLEAINLDVPLNISDEKLPPVKKTRIRKNKSDTIEQMLQKNNKQQNNIDNMMDILSKLDIKYDQLDLIMKLDPTEIINLDMFMKLKDILNKPNTKSRVMEELNIMKSYIGFYNFIKGLRLDLPPTGLNAIAKTLGYSLAIVPIKNDTLEEGIAQENKLKINVLQNKFLEDIELKLSSIVEIDIKKEQKKNEQPKRTDTSVIMDYISSSTSDDLSILNNSFELFQQDILVEESMTQDTNIIGVNDIYIPQYNIPENIPNSKLTEDSEDNNIKESEKLKNDFEDFKDEFDTTMFQTFTTDSENNLVLNRNEIN